MPIYHVKFDICNCKLICLAGISPRGRGPLKVQQHMRTFKRTTPSPKAAKLLGQKVAYFKIQLKTDKSLSLFPTLNANTFTCATPTGAQSKFTFATSRVACNIGKSAKST